ncbi:WEB family protein At2g17940-like [Chenopodium quinoa]|uniref:WEB family protein n=1 Tax=Chenopodium quinoa TaxID=63459 RepID=A0A803KWG4_CHEQI|nr:WEB family protein At2g17940-like [Chenopodium quinoa]
MESEHGGVVVKGRAIIDTRPPFRSVKEAVALFGERVLVGEIYAKQLKEIQQVPKKEDLEKEKVEIVSAELEETKQSLQKAREEGNYMANCLKSLKQQLEETKRELHTLKAAKEVVKDHHHHTKAMNPEIEELKFVETNAKNNHFDNNNRRISYDHQQELFQKKKFVTFASPPSLTREIKQNDERTSKLGRSSSFRKDGKKKPGVAIMGWLFSRKKTSDEGDIERSPKV